MKTPQELQSIFDKFPKEKIELKNHKINLATDLSTMLNIVEAQLEMNKTASSRSNKIYSTLVSVIPEAKERSQINDSIIKGIDKKIQIVEKEIENVDKLAAELGVKSSAVDNYNKVLSELSQLKKTTSSLVSVNKNIQKLLK